MASDEIKKTKILIIEDDPFLLNMYSAKFENNDFIVFTAGEGEEAIKQAVKNLPDIILLDIMLPRMNGYEVLKRLKGEKATDKIPVILLSNLSQESEVEQGLALGADSYLIKAHHTPAEVVEKIKNLIN